MTAWSAIVAFILLKTVDVTVGLRVPIQQEILGADLVEHAVGDIEYDKKQNRVLCNITGRNLNSEYGLTENGDLHEMTHFNESRRRRSILKLGESINMAAQLCQTFTNMKRMSIEEGAEEEENHVPKSSDGQPRRQSITFDLSDVHEKDQIKRISHLLKFAGNKALSHENQKDKLHSKNGIGKRMSIFRRGSKLKKQDSRSDKTNGHTNGHTPISNGISTSTLAHRPSNSDGRENKAFILGQESRGQSFDRTEPNDIRHVSSSNILVNLDTLSLDKGERTGGVGEENPRFSTYM